LPEAPAHLLLDVLGTLVHDPFYEDLPRHLGVPFDQILADKDPHAWIEFEHGRIDEDEFLRRFFRDRRAFDHAGMLACFRAHYRYLPGVEALLQDLVAAGRSPHLFSNYPVWYRVIEERLGLSRYARWTLVSCETGHRKPDHEAFAHAVEFLDARPEQCLFVDDRPVNLDAARAFGMDTVRFVGAEDLRRQLVDRGVLP